MAKKSKKDLILEQIDLQYEMQKVGFNIVECGNCGSLLIHKCNEETNIVCYGCLKDMAKSDCPDFWYDGAEQSEEFNE